MHEGGAPVHGPKAMQRKCGHGKFPRGCIPADKSEERVLWLHEADDPCGQCNERDGPAVSFSSAPPLLQSTGVRSPVVVP